MHDHLQFAGDVLSIVASLLSLAAAARRRVARTSLDRRMRKARNGIRIRGSERDAH